MSITSGFFNSIGGDRKYNAEQMSAIFDGLINDGIYLSIGTAFVVEASTGNEIIVGKGRAWFNSTWVYNDAPLSMTLEESELILDRYDAVVIEINRNDAVREGTVKVIKGTPSREPVYPTLITTGDIHQYPLAYVYRTSNNETVTQADIINMVGSEQTPFVTGIVETLELDVLLQQWQKELELFISNNTNDFNTWYDGMKQMMSDSMDEFSLWAANEKQKFETWSEAEQTEFENWSENQKNEILEWFQHMKDQLSEDAAGNLQIQHDELVAEFEKVKDDLQNQFDASEQGLQKQMTDFEIEWMLTIGFTDGEKKFSDDGRITTATNSDGFTLTKTFNDDFSVCTLIIEDSEGAILGKSVKTFSPDGNTINTEITIN